MMRGGSDAQQLLSFRHSGVVNCLDIDVVTAHHDVTDFRVLLCISHLQNRYLICRIHISNGLKSRFYLEYKKHESIL